MSPKYWLMKAEPDPRVVKGKDVKFSVDDFESVKTTAWEGVRNHEAKNLMKEMKFRDKVLFYHSNCKVPGIAAFAEVSKEAHPDYTAWDIEHPYYDAKTDKENPKWFMVEVTISSRAKNFIPLALLRHIAASSEAPSDVDYIGQEGVAAIKAMALVNRGRLSVQRVNDEAWSIVEMMADKGGWDDMNFGKGKVKTSSAKALKTIRGKKVEALTDAGTEEPAAEAAGMGSSVKAGRKRKASDQEDVEDSPPRRSTRART